MNKISNHNKSKSYMVSIIMPSFNSEEFICESIQSVLEQTYKNWELIIIDNGSKDNTVNHIYKFQKSSKKIRLIHNLHNRGAGYARNIGLEISKGKYIAFLDSDDFWDITFLEKMINFSEKNNFYFVYCPYFLLKKEVNILNTVLPKATVKNILLSNPLSCLTVLIEKQKINYQFDINLRTHEDIDLWIKIIKNYGCAYSFNMPLAFYRQRKNSLSSNKLKNAIDRFNFLKQRMGFNYIKTIYYFIKYVFYGINKYFIKRN